MADLASLADQLEGTRLTSNGVSFAGKALKLNAAVDAQQVVEAIEQCERLEFLQLEGNTLGPEAASVIGTALEKCPHMRLALWNNMFTGRSKHEIPPALAALSAGLMKAGARLEVLELSDNAMGPIGIDGILDLLKSPVCYGLKELRLNNLGLGISGATKLAKALTECYHVSKRAGTPLGLRVFIGGRNRLENEGAKALAKVFLLMKTLEEVQIPQNGIFPPGIKELSQSFASNPNLQVLNLSDNTPRSDGAEYIAGALPALQKLRVLDLSDCLLKNAGAESIAAALKKSHIYLEELNLTGNEMQGMSGMAVARAMAGKRNLKSVKMGCNNFGGSAVEIERILSEVTHGSDDVICDLSDDEGSEVEEEDDYDDEETNSEDDSENEEKEDDEGEGDTYGESWGGHSEGEDNDEQHISPLRKAQLNGNAPVPSPVPKPENRSIVEIDSVPITDLTNIDDSTFATIKSKIQDFPPELKIEELLRALGCITSSKSDLNSIEKLGMDLYKEVFSIAAQESLVPLVNNLLPAYLGLIKLEKPKQRLPTSNHTQNLNILRKAMTQSHFPKDTAEIIKFLTPLMEK